MELWELLHTLGSDKRLAILEWLADPDAHFSPQRDGDLVEDGVCVVFIADKLGVAQPTATRHLQQLARAGLVKAKRQKGWTFYRRDERALEEARQRIAGAL